MNIRIFRAAGDIKKLVVDNMSIHRLLTKDGKWHECIGSYANECYFKNKQEIIEALHRSQKEKAQ
jgi:hypothetical protein